MNEGEQCEKIKVKGAERENDVHRNEDSKTRPKVIHKDLNGRQVTSDDIRWENLCTLSKVILSCKKARKCITIERESQFCSK